MIRRWQENLLRQGLSDRRGVYLTGARQCGKSTLAEFVAGGQMRHLTLDEAIYLKAAKDDPMTFVDRRDGRTLVIDEVQKAPELLNAIKVKVDHDNSRGQYLITGSSNLHFVKEVSDSLAGRLGRVRLRTMTLGELKGGAGDFLQRAFAHDFPQALDKFDKRDVIHCAFCGGYPEPLEFSVRSRKAWYREYLDDLLRKDIRDMTEIRKLDSLRKVAHWLLAYSSKFFEMKDGTVWQGLSHSSTLVRCGAQDEKVPEFEKAHNDHYRNFLLAVKGEEEAKSPFSVAAPLSEVFCLGVAAQRLNRGFKFDPAKKRAIGDSEVDLLLQGPAPRKGWEEYYSA